MAAHLRVLLASKSPRRKLLLERAGIPTTVQPPDLDDGELYPRGVAPDRWVMALSHFKARRVAEMLEPTEMPRLILAADTICVLDDDIIGQPRDVDHVREMLISMRRQRHCTVTGVCLLNAGIPRGDAHRLLFVDRAVVHVGDISDAAIEKYISTGEWRGKAGGYNLAERLADGWPIEVDGDPTTVMGLPMRLLEPILRHEIAFAPVS